MQKPDGQWDTMIRPPSGWFDFRPAEIWRYRDLVRLFVWRDFVSVYKQTILGPLWYILQPLLTTLVFTVIFGRVASLPTDGLPPFLFYLSGVIAWKYFADCLNNTSNTFVANAHLFSKVYFPRLTVPVSVVISNLVSFAIQFGMFLGFLIFYRLGGADIHLQPAVLLLPLLLLQMAALGLGFGIIVSSLTTRYRDLAQLVSFGVQLWMYLTPVVYPASSVPERLRFLLLLNPMTSVVESFRYAFMGTGSIQLPSLFFSLALTALVLLFAVVLFSRVEKTFMDTV